MHNFEYTFLHMMQRLTVIANFDVPKSSASAADIAGIPGIILIVLWVACMFVRSSACAVENLV